MFICMECHSQNWSSCMCSSALKQGGRCERCRQFQDQVTDCFSQEPLKPLPPPVLQQKAVLVDPMVDKAQQLASLKAKIKFLHETYEGAKKNLDAMALELQKANAEESTLVAEITDLMTGATRS